MDNNIKFLIHNNFRAHFSNTRPVEGKVFIKDIPILINQEPMLCSFESDIFNSNRGSRLLWSITNINLLGYKILTLYKEPIFILNSNQLATSFLFLEMAQQDLKIILYKEKNKTDKIEIILPLTTAKGIVEEFRTNNNSACINWLTKDEMLKNK